MKTDRYLDYKEQIDRLVSEYRKYKTLVVAYDYDNTVFDFHAKGDTYPATIQLLQEAKELGCHLIVYTACPKSQYADISKYLRINEIPFDSINEESPFVPVKSDKKLYFNILLDDRAGFPAAFVILQTTLFIIKNASN